MEREDLELEPRVKICKATVEYKKYDTAKYIHDWTKAYLQLILLLFVFAARSVGNVNCFTVNVDVSSADVNIW